MSSHARTPFDKICDAYVVRHAAGEPAPIYIHGRFLERAIAPLQVEK
jgi:hypothetical protein